MTNATTKRVIYSCPFVPSEWIRAHGLVPSRIAPAAKTQLGGNPGACPYALAFANEVLASTDAAIFTTACDQMRRAVDLMPEMPDSNVFLMTVPHTWQQAGARQMYMSELKRLSKFLCKLGGGFPTPEALAQVMSQSDAARATIRAARKSVSPRQYSEMISHFQRTGEVSKPDNVLQPVIPRRHDEESAFSGKPYAVGTASEHHTPGGSTELVPTAERDIQGKTPIALVGGPLMSQDFRIFDMVEEAGGFVALDATETGERTLPAPFDTNKEPFDALVDAYFGSIRDPFRRPNTLFYDWLGRRMEQEDVRGIILRRYVWCDNWHAEAERLKEVFDLPLLHIDVSDDGTDAARTLYRLQSFMEMLR